jgi:hypothetical protein
MLREISQNTKRKVQINNMQIKNPFIFQQTDQVFQLKK